MDKAFTLSETQKAAFKALNDAFNACERAGVEIYGEQEVLYAINSQGLGRRLVRPDYKNSSVSEEAEYIIPNAFKGFSAHDGFGLSQYS